MSARRQSTPVPVFRPGWSWGRGIALVLLVMGTVWTLARLAARPNSWLEWLVDGVLALILLVLVLPKPLIKTKTKKQEAAGEAAAAESTEEVST